MNISQIVHFPRPVTGAELIGFVRSIVGEDFHAVQSRDGFAIGRAGMSSPHHLLVLPSEKETLVHPGRQYHQVLVAHTEWNVLVHNTFLVDAEIHTLKAIKDLSRRLEEAASVWPQEVMVCGMCGKIVSSMETGCTTHPEEAIKPVRVTPA